MTKNRENIVLLRNKDGFLLAFLSNHDSVEQAKDVYNNPFEGIVVLDVISTEQILDEETGRMWRLMAETRGIQNDAFSEDAALQAMFTLLANAVYKAASTSPA